MMIPVVLIALLLLGGIGSFVGLGWLSVQNQEYSNDIVYNNFPWPTPTPEQKAAIEKTAQVSRKVYWLRERI